MREYTYHLCDVFTSTRFQGNQLAIFENAEGLSNAEMQRLANETNLSETTFIQRRSLEMEAKRGIRVRIFTTHEELPFAGHPTLGTASFIRNYLPEYANSNLITLELNVGAVPVRFEKLYGEMTQPEPVFGALHDRKALAEAMDVPLEALDERFEPQTISTGMAQCIVTFRSLDALASLRTSWTKVERYLQNTDAKFIYCIAPEVKGVWRARMQFYGGEDPATGSAAGCAIAYLVRNGLAVSDEQVHIHQGIEIGRPSEIGVRAKFDSERVSEVRVSGSTVFVAEGRFFLE